MEKGAGKGWGAGRRRTKKSWEPPVRGGRERDEPERAEEVELINSQLS